MNDIDRLLDEAGKRWRASEPPPAPIDPAALVASSRRGSLAWSFAAGATGAALVLVIAWVAMQQGFGPRVGGPAAPTVQPSQANASCNVTRPDPRFVAPSPYPASPPPDYGSEWFGSEALWTMLNRGGEVWNQSDLPHGPRGLSQKTFWWSAEWPGTGREPEPAITVVGTRLDGPGAFTYGPGTNAGRHDFGEAMLLGIEIPTPGCWQLTGRYRDAVLSYVVWITND